MVFILLLFFLLLFMGVSVAFSMGVVCVILMWMGGFGLETMLQRMASVVNSTTMLALPMFLLAGNLMAEGGLTKRLLRLVNLIVGKVPGGMAAAGVGSCALFGAISGSAPATAFAIGAIVTPELKRQNYGKGFIGTMMASGGTLGLIIPPSVSMVILCSAANISIGRLFLAGFIPGIILALMLMAYAVVVSYQRGYGICQNMSKLTSKELLIILRDAILPLLAPVIILGGIFSGLMTTTESAAVAVFYGFILSLFYKEMTWEKLGRILSNTLVSAASILVIMAASNALGWILTVQRVPEIMSAFFMQYASSPISFLLIVSFVMFILGMFTEIVALSVLLAPMFLPIATKFGIDPIHFGMVMVMNFAVAGVTPPVGPSLMAGMRVTDIGMGIDDLFPDIVWVVGCMLVAVLIIIFFPGLSTYLPNKFM